MFIQFISLIFYTTGLLAGLLPQTVDEKLYQFIVAETEIKDLFQDFNNPVVTDSTKLEVIFLCQESELPTLYSENFNIHFMNLEEMFFPGIIYFLIIDEIKEVKNRIYLTLYFTNDLDISLEKIPQYAIYLTVKKKKKRYKLEDQIIERLNKPVDLKKYIKH